jgi:hypothetical protein
LGRLQHLMSGQVRADQIFELCACRPGEDPHSLLSICNFAHIAPSSLVSY